MKVPFLDHGYVEHIESWGSDQRIIESARMSTDKGFLGWDPGPCDACDGRGVVAVTTFKVWDVLPRVVPATSYENAMIVSRGQFHYEARDVPCTVCNGKGRVAGDAKLLRFLYDKKHSSPFEFAGMTIELQAPIMVFREWHRHRTQAYAELSARYTPLPDQSYMPTPERCLLVSATNKQAGRATGADELTHESALEWLEELAAVYEHIEIVYQSGLRRGIPKELARLPVGVGRYTRMRATGNLRNWLMFLTLRRALDAQFEIRAPAHIVGDLISEHFPRTWDIFANPTEKTS